MGISLLSMPLLLAGVVSAARTQMALLADETSSAKETKDHTGQKCCCATSSSEKCVAENGYFYECLSFVNDSKCCKSMARCEQQNQFMQYFFDRSRKYVDEADPALCGGSISLPPSARGGSLKGPAGDSCSKQARAQNDKMKFFEQLNAHANTNPALMNRDYTIIVDRSGSMGGMEEVYVPDKIADKNSDLQAGRQLMSLWNEARAALVYLAHHCVKEDKDGISMILFDDSVEVNEHVRTAHDVMRYFDRRGPGGKTNLADALAEALTPDNVGRAETILVITDGLPNNKSAAESKIVKAAQQLCRDPDLAITFIQIGTDKGATSYLQHLDDDLQCQYKIFDILDAMPAQTLHGKGFLDIIADGIYD